MTAHGFRVVATWLDVTCEHHYLTALARWTDAAREFFFEHPSESNPFHLPATQGWVIRSHRFRLTEPRSFHERYRFRTPIDISTRVVRIGNTSLQVEHDLSVEDAHLIAKVSSTVICINDEGSALKLPFDKDRIMRESAIHPPSLDWESEITAPKENKPVTDDVYKFFVRPSDLDSLKHVNNGVFFYYLQDSRLALSHDDAKQVEDLPAVQTLYMDFSAPLFLGEEVRIVKWTEDHGASECYEMTVQRGKKTVIASRAKLDCIGKL